MFAEVVLSNASPKLDKIFHYSIPTELEGLLVVGSQVEIPFGKSNRIGYVVGFVEKSSVPGIKPICKIVSDTPAFTKNGLELAKWLSEYYLSFFSTSLRAILPPGTRNKHVKRISTKRS
jgi:primosomal protein N' (replication factor Y)